MALLDTFISVFEADTQGLKEGHEQARRSTNEIVESMKKAERQSKQTGEAMITMAKRAGSFLVAAIASGKAISSAIQEATDINRLNQTAEALGVNISQMDAFRRSIEDAGGTASGAESSLVNAFKAIGEAASNTESEQAKMFSSLGVNLRNSDGSLKDTISIVGELAGAFSEMESAQAFSAAQKLGISDQTTIETLLRGREALERNMRAQEELGVITQENAEKAVAFHEANRRLAGGMDRLRLGFMDRLLPVITVVTSALSVLVAWMNQHGDFVIGFFTSIVAIISAKFLPILITLGSKLIAMAAPFLLVAAAITGLGIAFALAYDDIRNFLAGNDSFIGQVIEQYPALGRVITSLLDAVTWAFSGIGEALGWVSDKFGVTFDGIGGTVRGLVHILLSMLNSVAEWGEGFGDGVRDAANTVVAIFEWLGEQVARLIAPIKAAFDFASNGVGAIRDKASAGFSRIGGWLGLGDDDDVAVANNVLNTAANDPMNSVTNQSISNSSAMRNENNVQVGEITIQTQSTDATGISRDVRSELSDQLKNLNSETATGVAR